MFETSIINYSFLNGVLCFLSSYLINTSQESTNREQFLFNDLREVIYWEKTCVIENRRWWPIFFLKKIYLSVEAQKHASKNESLPTGEIFILQRGKIYSCMTVDSWRIACTRADIQPKCETSAIKNFLMALFPDWYDRRINMWGRNKSITPTPDYYGSLFMIWLRLKEEMVSSK